MGAGSPATPTLLTLRLRFGALLAVLCLSVPVAAQQSPNLARGFTPGESYDSSGLDSVNLYNGNLSLVLGLGLRYPADGGFDYGLKLIYNSTIWDFSTTRDPGSPPGVTQTQANPNRSSNSGIGWTLSLGGQVTSPAFVPRPDRWRFVSEDGSEHAFYDTLHVSEGEPNPAHQLYSRDGSYLRLIKESETRVRVEFPDGHYRIFEEGPVTGLLRLVEIRDRWGGGGDTDVTVSYDDDGNWTIQGPYRTHTVNFRSIAGRRVVDEVRLTAFPGSGDQGVAKYTFLYTSPFIQRSCKDNSTQTSPTLAVPLLAAVEGPEGTSYRMEEYFTSCDGQGAPRIDDLPGTLRRLRLPTRGQIQWSYQTYRFVVSALPGQPETAGASSNAGVASKRLLDTDGSCWSKAEAGCEWTYDPTGPGALGGFDLARTVTDPAGNDTVHYFTMQRMNPSLYLGWQHGLPFRRGVTRQGRFLSQEIYEGTGAGRTLERSVYVLYEHDRLANNTVLQSFWRDSNRRLKSRQVVYHDNGGRTAETAYSRFDGYGNYRRTVYRGTLGGSPDRTEVTEYNPHTGTYEISSANNQPTGQHGFTPWPASRPWVLATYDQARVDEGADSVKAQYCFDANTGFLRRQRLLAGANLGTADVLRVFTPGSSGHRIREQHYGGDRQAVLETTSNLCTLGLPGVDALRIDHGYQFGSLATSRYVRADGSLLPHLSVNRVIDQRTGLVSRSTGPAGVFVDYTYDALGRLTTSKPQGGTDAWTIADYDAAVGNGRATVHLRRVAAGGGATRTQSRFTYL